MCVRYPPKGGGICDTMELRVSEASGGGAKPGTVGDDGQHGTIRWARCWISACQKTCNLDEPTWRVELIGARGGRAAMAITAG